MDGYLDVGRIARWIRIDLNIVRLRIRYIVSCGLNICWEYGDLGNVTID